jgi:hypothetical protein
VLVRTLLALWFKPKGSEDLFYILAGELAILSPH